MDKINLQVIRQSFGKLAWTHKTHEKSAELEEGKIKNVKWGNIILTGLTLLFFCASIIAPEQKCLLYISTVLVAVTFAFTVYLLSFNPERLAESHRYLAKELWSIKERYISLIADIMNEKISEAEIVRRRDQLIQELGILYKFAPQTTPEAYALAGNALKKDEESTISNEEINKFLPEELHITE